MNIKVTAGPHFYRNCPISTPIDVHDLGIGEASLVDDRGNRIPCQLYNDHGIASVAWIEHNMEPGEIKVYRLETASIGVGNAVDISDAGKGILEVKICDSIFTNYHYGTESPRPYLYPLMGPGQANITRNYPMKNVDGEDKDHKHHRSVWVAYGDVNGTDNWTEEEGHAFIRHQKFEEVTGGPILGRIRSVNSWLSKDNVKQMEDIREFTFYNLESERIIDVDIKFIASSGDVTLGDTKEGGIISVRVASSMDGNKGGIIINSYGAKTESETWGKPAQWVDYVGPVEGRTMGIAIMDHPVSFRYPSRWHVRDYGLFAANPFALKHYEPENGISGDYTIKNGESIRFKYRLYIHEGDTVKAEVSEKYFGFIAPPKVEVQHSGIKDLIRKVIS